MTGRTVWLASYPKSGNTWVRAIITALGTHPELFGVDRLAAGAQPHHTGAAIGAFGIDARFLSADENRRLRTALTRRIDDASTVAWPVLRKTHELFRGASAGYEPFDLESTRAAVLVVRDPRDVACSYAAFFGVSIDDAIAAMADEGGDAAPNPARGMTEQPWGTWSTHASTWLSDDVPFPVELVRYEDLQADAVAALLPVLDRIGLPCTRVELEDAIGRTNFERLQESEADRGFRETHTRTEQFFRRGIEGGWRDELSVDQVREIERAHGEVMDRLGYGRAASDTALDPLRLPASLGIRVTAGELPDHLPDAESPRPWIEVSPTQALLRFRGRAGVLVENGTDVTVDRGRAGADDVGWMVQGWGVTLAMLQRGMLSLHASTVRIDDRVIAIAGARGAGKSTTAMGLRGRGHGLLCDDVTLVEFRDAEAWTTPYWRNVHLLEDSAAALGVDFESLAPLGHLRMKSAFRPEESDETQRRIERIVVLTIGDFAGPVTSNEPIGSARMAALLDHTDRDGIAPLILGQGRYFAQVAQLADTVPVTVVARPSAESSLESVLDIIEALP